MRLSTLYKRSVSTHSREDLSRTSSSWLDQHVNLVQLRPLVTETLKVEYLSTRTLTDNFYLYRISPWRAVFSPNHKKYLSRLYKKLPVVKVDFKNFNKLSWRFLFACNNCDLKYFLKLIQHTSSNYRVLSLYGIV